jgi:hypothetical protein
VQGILAAFHLSCGDHRAGDQLDVCKSCADHLFTTKSEAMGCVVKIDDDADGRNRFISPVGVVGQWFFAKRGMAL